MIRVCTLGRKQRKPTVKSNKRPFKRRNQIEIMFGRLREWRHVATRYDRCALQGRSGEDTKPVYFGGVRENLTGSKAAYARHQNLPQVRRRS